MSPFFFDVPIPQRAPVNPASPSPRRLGKYEIVSKIGDGGMASVFRARLRAQLASTGVQTHRAATKQVALKVIHPDLSQQRDFILMFFEEVRLAMEMTHRNIVQTFDAGSEEGQHYYVMEHVTGCSLRDLLDGASAEGGQLPIDVCLFIGMEVCAALQYAHTYRADRGGVIHRDVSPSNILLSAQGEVKLADFGIAKAARGLVMTTAAMVKGKLSYMAPEQARGMVEPRSDLFAVGAVLYEALCGVPMRERATVDSVRNTTALPMAPAAHREEISPALSRLVLRCVAADPRERPDDAGALCSALREELFRLQLKEGSRDMHATLREFLAAQPGLLPPAKPDEPSRATDENAARLAQAVLAGALEIPTTPGKQGAAPAATATSGGGLCVADAAAAETTVDEQETIAEAATLVARPAAPEARTRDLRASDAAAVQRIPRGEALGGRRGRIAFAAVGLALASVAISSWLWLRSSPIAQPLGPADGASGRSADSRPGGVALAGTELGIADASAGSESAANGELAAPRLARRPDARSTPPRRPPAATRPGVLDINAVPWAEVYVDGRLRGQTPVQGISLSPGKHQVRLVNRRWRLSRSFQVRIRSGQRVRKLIHLQ